MVRQLHSLLGLVAAVLLLVLGISGAILSLDPTLERLDAIVPANGQVNVATLAGRVAQHYPEAEQIQRTPSGSVIDSETRKLPAALSGSQRCFCSSVPTALIVLAPPLW